MTSYSNISVVLITGRDKTILLSGLRPITTGVKITGGRGEGQTDRQTDRQKAYLTTKSAPPSSMCTWWGKGD